MNTPAMSFEPALTTAAVQDSFPLEVEAGRGPVASVVGAEDGGPAVTRNAPA
nr:hypothetical protein KPHV_08490 [Kitasatospora purpeofusca]